MANTIEPLSGQRISSIDLLRGAVMVIMALDHVRDYFGHGAWTSDPTDLATTTPALFFTRWITHYCAPVFVFLSGASAFLYGSRAKSTAALSRFLLTRGLWLIAMELTVIGFGWSFDILLRWHMLQVIWAIGISMVVLSALVFLPRWAILVLGIVLVGGHNLLDPITTEGESWTSIAWYVLHQGNLVQGDGWIIFIGYPVLPWIGLMALGYSFGRLYAPTVAAADRRRTLLWIGSGAVALFILLRALNNFGESWHWEPQKNAVFQVMSFLNTTKYPPSLLYVLMTIGPAILFLAWSEQWRGRTVTALVNIGRVPFFYYVLHIYLIHALALIGVAAQGRPISDFVVTPQVFLGDSLATYGYPLWAVYAVWIGVVLALYPLCRWYGDYRARHREKWWLSYL
ncbi:MAG: heparan-alpha-glucosaminide N-acetyltransferase domain-containing protein [Flavobacteriales bacterium]